MTKLLKLHITIILLTSCLFVNAQTKKRISLDDLKNWHHADLKKESIIGISTNKAYEFLKDKKGETVIVGVIDSSIDILHEDLNNKIWKNIDEIENNGIDDDKNGYIDDINGWNFAGNLIYQNYEYERIIMNPSLAENKNILNRAKKEYESRIKEAKKDIKDSRKVLKKWIYKHKIFTKHLGKENYTLNEVFNFKKENSKLSKEINDTKKWINSVSRMSNFDPTFEPIDTNSENIIINLININKKDINKDSIFLTGQTIKINYREKLGDNIQSLEDKNYGNKITNQFLEEEHGTHVAGIIAANRNNILKPIRFSGFMFLGP